ncbi:MAG: asparagine synthase-related protein [Pantoea sp.]|uniref:asparagine synthase-related protein n=1 Tax=Pantoea sp. TaxID=69393 RepID=UPI0039E63877
MLVIASANIFADLKLNSDELTFFKHQHICVAAGSRFEVRQTQHEMTFYCGLSFFRQSTGTGLTGETYESRRETLKDADGYFLLAAVSGHRVACCRSLYRHHDVYYWQRGNSFIISTDLRVIVSASQTHSIDSHFLSLFINSDSAASCMSPVSSVRKLEGGCELILEDNKFCVSKLVSVHPGSGNYLDTMSDLLKSVSERREVYLHFSGGLDSTLIFLLLKEAGIKFTALHHDTYAFEKDSETNLARAFCEKHGVDLHIIRPAISLSDDQCRSSHPMDCSSFFTSFSSESFSYCRLDPGKSVVLDGHGGDSLFVQNPSEKVGFELLKKGKIFSAYGKMSDLCLLKNLKLTEMLSRNTRRVFSRKGLADDRSPGHIFSQHLDPRSPQFDYLNDLINMMETRPVAGSEDYVSFSPILSLNSVRSFMSHEYAGNFSDEYDRLWIRNMLYNRFSEPCVYEKRKRPSVSTIYHLIKIQKDNISHVIENTSLPDHAGLDKAKLRESLAYNSSVRIDEDAYRLLRLSVAHQYYASLNLA